MEVIVDLKGNVYKEQIVRCVDCRHYKRLGGFDYCEWHGDYPGPDDYCSCGERKEVV